MANEQKGFGGILGKIKQMAMTPEYLAELEEQEKQLQQQAPSPQVVETKHPSPPPVPLGTTRFATKVVQPTVQPVQVSMTSSPVNPEEIQKMAEKFYAYLESINKPGMDYLEFWNAVEAMEGGPTDTNIKNAFVMMEMMSGKTVTKASLIQTGNEYVNELSQQVGKDIQSKESQKAGLQNKLNSEKEKLEREVSDLEEEIREKQELLASKKIDLGAINEKHAPEMIEMDNAIAIGKTSLNIVTQEMKNFISRIQQVLS